VLLLLAILSTIMALGFILHVKLYLIECMVMLTFIHASYCLPEFTPGVLWGACYSIFSFLCSAF